MFYTKPCSFPGSRFAWGGNSPSTYPSKTNLILWSHLNDTRARYMCDALLSRCLRLSIYVSLLSFTPLNGTLNDRNPLASIRIKKKRLYTHPFKIRSVEGVMLDDERSTQQCIYLLYFAAWLNNNNKQLQCFRMLSLCTYSLLMKRRGRLVYTTSHP